MRYQAEETIHNFPFWSGAKDTIAELTYDEMNSLEQLIEEIFDGGDELPTDTEINDFVWFERDTIAQHLGYDDFDELMHRNDEPNLPTELTVDAIIDIDEDWEDFGKDDKLSAIDNYLYEEYEECAEDFDWEEDDCFNVHIYNIKWDTTE